MAERANLMDDSIDRVQEAVRSVEDEFDKLSQRVATRRKKLERDTQRQLRGWQKELRRNGLYRRAESLVDDAGKELESRRKSFEKRTKRWEKEIRSNDLVKRAETFADDATKQIESGVDSILRSLQIASRGDVEKLDRKLSQISRKLKALEKERGAQPAAAADETEAQPTA